MTMRNEITGERIVLKAYEESFIPSLYEAAFESSLDSEFRYWMPWCHKNYSIEDSRAFVEKTVENWRETEYVWRPEMQFDYAILDAKNGKFIGGVGLNQPNKIHKFFNLGYWVRPTSQKRGTASEAARMLAKAAFEDISELNRIEILAAAENIPSRKTAEKAGAKFEGILRKRLNIGDRIHDAALFSFVCEDFR